MFVGGRREMYIIQSDFAFELNIYKAVSLSYYY